MEKNKIKTIQFKLLYFLINNEIHKLCYYYY